MNGTQHDDKEQIAGFQTPVYVDTHVARVVNLLLCILTVYPVTEDDPFCGVFIELHLQNLGNPLIMNYVKPSHFGIIRIHMM